MATVSLQLPEPVERQLQARAAELGRDAASVAIEILEKEFSANKPIPNANAVPYDEWHRDFMNWIESRPRIDVQVDDSRETVYEGR